MLIRQQILGGIADGRISLAFRRWTRPTVKAGGTLLTAIGQLAIDTVEPVDAAMIDDAEAVCAGYANRGALLAELDQRGTGPIYRIALRYIGADPRIALRADADLDDGALTALAARLERLDRNGAWTKAALELIAAHPARRAGDLAAMLGQETAPFKLSVRKLKALGLTESLEVGYCLSPRGEAIRTWLQRQR